MNDSSEGGVGVVRLLRGIFILLIPFLLMLLVGVLMTFGGCSGQGNYDGGERWDEREVDW